MSANKLAVLGDNLLILLNLVGLAVTYMRFALLRKDFASVVRWQTTYLAVYGAWAVVVAIAFPPIFSFG